MVQRRRPLRRNNRARQTLGLLFQPQVVQQFLLVQMPVRSIAQQHGQWTARTHHRIEQPPGGRSVANSSGWPPAALRPDAPPADASDVPTLADQHDWPVLVYVAAQRFDASRFQRRFRM